MRAAIRTVFAALAACLLPAAALAVEPERCPRLISFEGARPVPAALGGRLADMDSRVRLTFVGHSTFLIESPAGVTIATDYNDYLRPPAPPTIATMNRAHSTHYSLSPDPAIRHLLPGWGEDGNPARHEIAIDDVWVRNVTTNIRGGGRDLNSIFVFEVAGLCIAHLGHLHHRLTDAHLGALGRIDVVLAPVDGSYTLDLPGMIEVLQAIQAPLVIPMHFFGPDTLARFLSGMAAHYRIEHSDSALVVLSRTGLPTRPTVLVLPGY